VLQRSVEEPAPNISVHVPLSPDHARKWGQEVCRPRRAFSQQCCVHFIGTFAPSAVVAYRRSVSISKTTARDAREDSTPRGELNSRAEGDDVVPAIQVQIEPDGHLMARLEEILASGHVTNDGPELVAFEREIASWLGVANVVAVASGSAALVLGLVALRLKPGRVILPSFTYIATLNAIVQDGREPLFADIDPVTWTLCPDSVASLLASHDDVAAIVAVNAYGVPADLDALAALAKASGCALISDSAHAIGMDAPYGRVHPEPVVQAWSLHATKVLPAVEGGLVTTPSAEVAEEVRRLRRHGLASDVSTSGPGFNARMDELRAAVARHSLVRLDDALTRRRAYSARLRAHLTARCDGLFQLQGCPSGVSPNGQNLAVLWRGAGAVDDAIAALADEGVEGRRYFWPALHTLQRFAGHRPLPVTEEVTGRVLCLPLYGRMDERTLVAVERATEAVARRLGA
jgi:dTDP-4-amino-4,6-dideoxygalactose transaminase